MSFVIYAVQVGGGILGIAPMPDWRGGTPTTWRICAIGVPRLLCR